MTRTDGVVSNRPQAAGTASIGGISRGATVHRGRRRIARRELLALPAALALMVPAAPAFAQTSSTGTSGYNQKPPTPTTTTEAKKETAPSKESTTPKTTPSPTTTTPTTTTPTVTTAPTTTTTTPKASTLPFTGLNLTWVVGAGVLLLAAGLSIRLAQRTRASR
jgi:cytoskeletal protein RodZ